MDMRVLREFKIKNFVIFCDCLDFNEIRFFSFFNGFIIIEKFDKWNLYIRGKRALAL